MFVLFKGKFNTLISELIITTIEKVDNNHVW